MARETERALVAAGLAAAVAVRAFAPVSSGSTRAGEQVFIDWAHNQGNTIGRANLDGTAPRANLNGTDGTQNFIGGPKRPRGVAVG